MHEPSSRLGLIYSEVRALWTNGLKEYMADLWNIVDFITNCFYLVWIGLRFTAIYIVMVRFDLFKFTFYNNNNNNCFV